VAAELQERLGIQPELIEGDRGVFDVRVDGDLVFSKYGVRRFPKPGEVPDIIEARRTVQPRS
jgi:hypothetical protein